MSITAADVNKLRQMTGAGMMDCKKALTEAEGDFEAAVDILRKAGQKVAAKRADNETNEGVVLVALNADHSNGKLIALACETEPVSKVADFNNLAKTIIDTAAASRLRRGAARGGRACPALAPPPEECPCAALQAVATTPRGPPRDRRACAKTGPAPPARPAPPSSSPSAAPGSTQLRRGATRPAAH